MKSIYEIDLNQRREQLGMTLGNLSKRSGVSLPTVKRVLAGKHGSFVNVVRIAEALGMSVSVTADDDSFASRKKQAAERARRLVRLVQGTSALESQAVEDERSVQEMIEMAEYELLYGRRRGLWE